MTVKQKLAKPDKEGMVSSPKFAKKRLKKTLPKFLLLGAVVSFFSFGKSFAVTEEDTQKKLDGIQLKYGPIVATQALPKTYADLNEVLNRLNIAQRKMISDEVKSIENKLFIIDSPLSDAFVTSASDDPHELKSMIFLTTGLLKEYTSRPNAEEATAGTLAVLGSLGHELSHPIDKMDKEGFEQNGLTAQAKVKAPQAKNYSAKLDNTLSAQARELRADADAISLLRAAGYPTEALYQTFRQLEAHYEPAPFLTSYGEDHPPLPMRQSAQRLNLTQSRYKIGSDGVAPYQVSYLKEIESYAGEHWEFVNPTSIHETIERALAIPSLKRDNYYRTIEFNRLILTLDRQLAQAPNLNTNEQKKIEQLFESMVKQWWEFPRLLSGNEIKKNFTRENKSLEFVSDPPHAKRLESLAYYQSPAHQRWVRKTFQDWWGGQRPVFPVDFQRGWTGMIQKAKLLPLIMAPADIFKTFDDQFKATFKSLFSKEGAQAGRNIGDAHFNLSRLLVDQDHVLSAQGPNLEMEYRLADFIRRARPSLDKNVWLSHVVNPAFGEGSESVVFPLTDYSGSSTRGRGIANNRQELAADPRKKALLENHKKILQEVWDQRGYYGTLDVVIEDMNMDWDTVLQGLGIPKDEGYSRLRSSVKEFTSSLAYANLLREWVKNPKIPEGLERLRNGDRVSKVESPEWFDRTLGPYFAGEHNRQIKRAPSLKSLAVKLFEKNYQRQYDYYYGETQAEAALTEYLNKTSPKNALKNINRLSNRIADLSDQDYQALSTAETLPVLARAIEESNWSEDEKKTLLRRIFVNPIKAERKGDAEDDQANLHHEAWQDTWSGYGIKSVVEKKDITKILEKNGVIKDHFEWVEMLRESPFTLKQDKKWLDLKKQGVDTHALNYLNQVAAFEPELREELSRRMKSISDPQAKKEFLLHFAEIVMKPSLKIKANPVLDNGAAARRLKQAILEQQAGLGLNAQENAELFSLLVYSGPSRETDEFFKAEVLPVYEKSQKLNLPKKLISLLKSDSVASNKLKVSLTEKILAAKFLKLSKNENLTREERHEFINEVQSLLPKSSAEKDDYLEKIAWQLKINGDELKQEIEPHKSYSWKDINPLWVNGGSELVSYAQQLSADSKAALIDHLMKPIGELPDFVQKEMAASLYREIVQRGLIDPDDEARGVDAKEKAEELATIAKARLEIAFLDSTPDEKIPLFEILLNGGRKGDWSAQEALSFAHKHLDYKPGSDDDLLLKSFLEVIPEHERSPSLAFLMSRKNEAKNGILSRAEVFDSVGIKGVQLASIYKIFGEQAAEEAKQAKSDAAKIPKIEHERILKSVLTDEEHEQLDLSTLKNVANASMKAVDFVKLKDGTDHAILLQRPHAENKIRTHIDLIGRFVRQLKKNGYQLPGGMTGSIIESLGEQMDDELLMTKEAVNVDEARQIYEDYNHRFQEQLGGWKFEVPKVSHQFKARDNLLFLNFIHGGADLDHVDPNIRAQVGPVIVKAALSSLFEKGWFNADSHAGNFLLQNFRIDEKNKKIWVIDLGQISKYSKTNPWSSDERYELARFTEAFSNQNAGSLVKIAQKMAKPGTVKTNEVQLKKEIQKVFSDSTRTQSDQLIDVMNGLAEGGVALKTKFSFGAFKGMLILQGENYVSASEFERLLKESVTDVFKEKKPRYILDNPLGAIKTVTQSVVLCFKNMLSGRNQAQRAPAADCPECGLSSPLETVSKSVRGMTESLLRAPQARSNGCSQVLSSQVERDFLRQLDSVNEKYWSGELSASEWKKAIEGTRKKFNPGANPELDKFLSIGTAGVNQQALQSRIALAALDRLNGHEISLRNKKKLAEASGLSVAEVESALKTVAEPLRGYHQALSKAGVSYDSSSHGWDIEHAHFNTVDLQSPQHATLKTALALFLSPQAMVSLSDPGRHEPISFQGAGGKNFVILPPLKNEIKVLRVEAYQQQFSAAFETYKDARRKFLVDSKKSNTMWNGVKQILLNGPALNLCLGTHCLRPIGTMTQETSETIAKNSEYRRLESAERTMLKLGAPKAQMLSLQKDMSAVLAADVKNTDHLLDLLDASLGAGVLAEEALATYATLGMAGEWVAGAETPESMKAAASIARLARSGAAGFSAMAKFPIYLTGIASVYDATVDHYKLGGSFVCHLVENLAEQGPAAVDSAVKWGAVGAAGGAVSEGVALVNYLGRGVEASKSISLGVQAGAQVQKAISAGFGVQMLWNGGESALHCGAAALAHHPEADASEKALGSATAWKTCGQAALDFSFAVSAGKELSHARNDIVTGAKDVKSYFKGGTAETNIAKIKINDPEKLRASIQAVSERPGMTIEGDLKPIAVRLAKEGKTKTLINLISDSDPQVSQTGALALEMKPGRKVTERLIEVSKQKTSPSLLQKVKQALALGVPGGVTEAQRISQMTSGSSIADSVLQARARAGDRLAQQYVEKQFSSRPFSAEYALVEGDQFKDAKTNQTYTVLNSADDQSGPFYLTKNNASQEIVWLSANEMNQSSKWNKINEKQEVETQIRKLVEAASLDSLPTAEAKSAFAKRLVEELPKRDLEYLYALEKTEPSEVFERFKKASDECAGK